METLRGSAPLRPSLTTIPLKRPVPTEATEGWDWTVPTGCPQRQRTCRKRKLKRERGQEISTLNLPELPSASRNHKVFKEQNTGAIGGVPSRLAAVRGCTSRTRVSQPRLRGRAGCPWHRRPAPPSAAHSRWRSGQPFAAVTMLRVGNYLFPLL